MRIQAEETSTASVESLHWGRREIGKWFWKALVAIGDRHAWLCGSLVLSSTRQQHRKKSKCEDEIRTIFVEVKINEIIVITFQPVKDEGHGESSVRTRPRVEHGDHVSLVFPTVKRSSILIFVTSESAEHTEVQVFQFWSITDWQSFGLIAEQTQMFHSRGEWEKRWRSPPHVQIIQRGKDRVNRLVDLQRPNLIPLGMPKAFDGIHFAGQIDMANGRRDQRQKPRVAQRAKRTNEISWVKERKGKERKDLHEEQFVGKDLSSETRSDHLLHSHCRDATDRSVDARRMDMTIGLSLGALPTLLLLLMQGVAGEWRMPTELCSKRVGPNQHIDLCDHENHRLSRPSMKWDHRHSWWRSSHAHHHRCFFSPSQSRWHSTFSFSFPSLSQWIARPHPLPRNVSLIDWNSSSSPNECSSSLLVEILRPDRWIDRNVLHSNSSMMGEWFDDRAVLWPREKCPLLIVRTILGDAVSCPIHGEESQHVGRLDSVHWDDLQWWHFPTNRWYPMRRKFSAWRELSNSPVIGSIEEYSLTKFFGSSQISCQSWSLNSTTWNELLLPTLKSSLPSTSNLEREHSISQPDTSEPLLVSNSIIDFQRLHSSFRCFDVLGETCRRSCRSMWRTPDRSFVAFDFLCLSKRMSIRGRTRQECQGTCSFTLQICSSISVGEAFECRNLSVSISTRWSILVVVRRLIQVQCQEFSLFHFGVSSSSSSSKIKVLFIEIVHRMSEWVSGRINPSWPSENRIDRTTVQWWRCLCSEVLINQNNKSMSLLRRWKNVFPRCFSRRRQQCSFVLPHWNSLHCSLSPLICLSILVKRLSLNPERSIRDEWINELNRKPVTRTSSTAMDNERQLKDLLLLLLLLWLIAEDSISLLRLTSIISSSANNEETSRAPRAVRLLNVDPSSQFTGKKVQKNNVDLCKENRSSIFVLVNQQQEENELLQCQFKGEHRPEKVQMIVEKVNFFFFFLVQFSL